MYRKVNSNKYEKCLFKNFIFEEKTNIFINVVSINNRKGPNGTQLKILPKDLYLN